MSAFIVTVRTDRQRITYTAIGINSVDVHMDAIERFGVCAATVRLVGA